MSEAGRVEVNCQKEIVIAAQESNIPDVDATTDDQSILEARDQSKIDDYEGFLDLGFIPKLNPRKRKASHSGGAYDAKAGSSSAAGDHSTPPLSKKSKFTIDLNALDEEWDINVDEVIEIMIENNFSIRERKEARKG
ncbi:unnamed protein product [Lactuca saligna]|uniref:Uncharacterized protein n=1 Tax=Lactuca saligna TaxID=75948 RepID=A0AA35YAF2_LACSI|nr:unnamed protein product [Lactuca saligna]